MRKFAWPILLTVTTVALATTLVNVERNPVRTHPHAGATSGDTQHIIVGLRPAATGTHERLLRVAQHSGLALSGYRTITPDMHVIHVQPAAGESIDATLARLRADPEVRYAEPDAWRYIHTVPNDTLYATEQWYMMPSSATTPSAVDAQTAWSTTTGAVSLVIADIDTGVRFDHPDLLALSAGGRLLPGYCSINAKSAAANNNTICPGLDASDTGDWVTQADLTNTNLPCSGVQITPPATFIPSSWHGTRVAGILGAITENNFGIAGMTWGPKILPVRALGVCGGWDSDIITGTMWAAGISVAGALNNSTPANIINLSLGGTGSCPASWQDAINQINALGVLVVASAGNEGGPVDAPANCLGVVAVAGLRHAGTKVGFSNYGPEVALGAPAGNCVNTSPSLPCLYPITTTTNLGSQGPDTNDFTGAYDCDSSTNPPIPGCTVTGTQYRTTNLGTSFAAPQVAGIAALMRSVNSKLNACQLKSRLQEGALAYPQTSVGASTQPEMCPPLKPIDECICTRETCGAGMANAPGALTAALRPIAAVAVPASVSAGQMVQLDATGSAAVSGSITAYAWSNAGGAPIAITNPNTAKASLTLPSCGVTTVALTVTDGAGNQDMADVVISPTAVTTTAPATAGQASCSVTPPAVVVGVCPASGSVQAGMGTLGFTATLANTTNTAVTWQVNGITGGNSQVGTISTTGVYTPPANVPMGGSVTVKAVSSADSSATASAQVTVTSPPSSGKGGLDWLTLLVGGALAARRARRMT